MRIAIISFAHTHAIGYARILSERDDVELLTTDTAEGLVDGEMRGRLLAEKLGVPYVDTIDEVYAWGPDAVVVTSENACHLNDVRRAASEGVHVLCEKPLATTVAEASDLIEACETAGVYLMTAFPVHFAEEFIQLRDIVRSGSLGRVLTVSATNNGRLPQGRAWFTNPALSGGGAVTDHTVHVADLLFGLFPGEQVDEVFAVDNSILKPELAVETAGLISLHYTGGATAVIDCSWSLPNHYPTWGGLTLRIIGEDGDATIAPFALHLEGYSEPDRTPIWVDYGANLDQAMLGEFISAINEHRQPVPSGYDGLRCVEIVNAAYESIQARQPVTPIGSMISV